jgi:uncharacterized membrane protein YhaH (DUF805 family)
MNWYLAVLKNYVGFSGRARRTEYWMFVLFHLIVVVALSVLDRLVFQDGPGYLAPAYVLLSIVPAIAVVVRRLHDTGRSGWWYLIGLVPLVGGIVLLVFTVSEGNTGPNEYGGDPKHASLVAA